MNLLSGLQRTKDRIGWRDHTVSYEHGATDHTQEEYLKRMWCKKSSPQPICANTINKTLQYLGKKIRNYHVNHFRMCLLPNGLSAILTCNVRNVQIASSHLLGQTGFTRIFLSREMGLQALATVTQCMWKGFKFKKQPSSNMKNSMHVFIAPVLHNHYNQSLHVIFPCFSTKKLNARGTSDALGGHQFQSSPPGTNWQNWQIRTYRCMDNDKITQNYVHELGCLAKS